MIFLSLLYKLFKTARQGYLWSEDWVARGVCLGGAASVVALIVHGFGTITFLIVRIMEPFWLLTGVVA